MSSASAEGKGRLEELRNVTDFSALLKSTEPVLVDFSATWCGPCKILSPILEEVARRNQHWRFVKVDVDKFPSLATEYNVTSVPYVALFRGGKVAASFLGAKNALAVQKFLDDHK